MRFPPDSLFRRMLVAVAAGALGWTLFGLVVTLALAWGWSR